MIPRKSTVTRLLAYLSSRPILTYPRTEIRSGLGGRSLGIYLPGERKVRAPQDTVVGNAHRPQGPGKCNRKYTAREQLSVASCQLPEQTPLTKQLSVASCQLPEQTPLTN